MGDNLILPNGLILVKMPRRCDFSLPIIWDTIERFNGTTKKSTTVEESCALYTLTWHVK